MASKLNNTQCRRCAGDTTLIPVSDLHIWLANELKERGWSNNELARRAGMSSANMSGVLAGKYRVTFDFCFAVAEALRLPPELVFRRAGLLRPTNQSQDVQAIVDIIKHLSNDDLEMFREMALLMYRRKRNE